MNSFGNCRRMIFALLTVASFFSNHPAGAFSGFESWSSHFFHDFGLSTVASKTLIASSTVMAKTITTTASVPTTNSSFRAVGSALFQSYKQLLAKYPLATKMATGGTLAVVGDATAQFREIDEDYDAIRASSFCIFDMSYRALQHVSYPEIVNQCQGQYLGGLAALMTMDTDFAAALEETFVAQLVIIPFLYYPVYFLLTGYIQGLTMESSIERAKETFLPLMKRNLLFWIPVQLVQFGFIEENLQIPFLSCAGLVWTFILSIMSGSTSKYSDDENNETPDPFDEQEVNMNGQVYGSTVFTMLNGKEDRGEKTFKPNGENDRTQTDLLTNDKIEQLSAK